MENDFLKLIKNFEERNNISIGVTIYSDGSGNVEEFWDNEKLYNGKSVIGFLKRTNYKLDPIDGRCLSPVQKIKPN